MRTDYTTLTQAELAWKDNTRHVRRRIDEVLATLRDALVNEHLANLSAEFQAEKEQGRILRYGLEPKAIADALFTQASALLALEAGEDAETQ